MDKIYKKSQNNDYQFKHILKDIQEYVFSKIRSEQHKDKNLAKRVQLNGIDARHTNEREQNIIDRQALLDSGWFLAIAPENGPFFITSDNPGFSHGMMKLFIIRNLLTGFYSKNDQLKQIIPGVVKKDFIIATNNKSLKHINKILIASDTWYLSQIELLNNPNKDTGAINSK